MNTTEFFAAIKTEESLLSQQFPAGFCYVTSMKNVNRQSTAGTVSQVSTRIAARHIIENTGRISTEAEIAEHLETGRAFSAQMTAMGYRHAKHGSVYVTRKEGK